MPILPMVLVNGAEGIGTGWSTYVPNYNPREIAENLKVGGCGLCVLRVCVVMCFCVLCSSVMAPWFLPPRSSTPHPL